MYIFFPTSPALATKWPIILELKEAQDIINTSIDPKLLAMSAIYICNFPMENNSEEFGSLIKLLRKEDFLSRLDPGERFLTDLKVTHHLPLVLQAIGKCPRKGQILIELAKSDLYRFNPYRLKAVLSAIKFVREPASETMQILDTLIKSGPMYGEGVPEEALTALIWIGTPEATEIIENFILSPSWREDQFFRCIIYGMVPNRNNSNIVGIYKQLLFASRKHNEKFRNFVIQSLFCDKLTDSLFLIPPHVGPPDRHQASTSVLRELEQIAGKALGLNLHPETKEGIEKARKEIQFILKGRGFQDQTGQEAAKPQANLTTILIAAVIGMVAGLGLGIWGAHRRQKG